MNNTPILKGKHAVVFDAGGSIGAAVAKEFAAERAEVFLSGRTKRGIDAVAKQIAAEGGLAHAAEIDTLDDDAVNQYTYFRSGVGPPGEGPEMEERHE
jgi:NADP-dependent 3-hydroxy acid dehydrogenase YdfG